MRILKKLNLSALILLFIVSCKNDDDVCVVDNTLEIEVINSAEINQNHHSIYTDIVINAPINEVWNVLRDFDNYPEWSSSIQGITGDISNGGEVIVDATLPNGSIIGFHHILIYEEGIRFGWSDSLGIGTIMDNHMFIVEMISECQTRFIQTDEFRGIGNADFSTESLANTTLEVYPIFNNELKQRVEGNE